ncbi:hypothetical protein [Labilibaculum sp.]|uniref:hypothetical protein n=1 Tax=Labilibaculum sp. TaxID=2060723 RepID=UPI003561EA45
MKNAALIFTLFLLFFGVDKIKSQMVTYSGPVEYHLEMIKTAGGEGTDGGYDWNISVNEKRTIEGSFFVTFTGGEAAGYSAFQLTSIEENINYTNTVNNEGNDQKTKQACYDDRLVFIENATPGDSRTQRTSVNTSRVNPEKPVIDGGQMMFRGNKYTFILMGEMKVKTNMETYLEETFPCLDTIIPPKTMSTSTTVDMPIVISGEKALDNRNILEGVYMKTNETSNDCNKCLGSLGRMVHGDVNCSYISKITTSWTLVKRTKECDASVTYLKGDVKINGEPAKKGTTKIGAGDVIETGEKSRISISLKNGNEIYQLGSKSKLQLTNPCKPSSGNPQEKGQAVVNFLKGKIFSQRNPGSYTRDDFESEEDWQRFKSQNISWFRYGGAGVRGYIVKAPTVYFASINSNTNHYYLAPSDPEKEELIPEFSSIPNHASAFYMHCEDGEVKDLTVVKGTLKIEDSYQLKSMELNEGTVINKWNDGTIISNVVISTK